MALAIDGPSTLDRCSVHMCLGLRTEVPPVEALLHKRFLVQASQARAGRDWVLSYSPSVSVALVVLPVLLGVNPLSSVSAVELDLDMVPFGHRTCTTCRCSILDCRKFVPCIVCMYCIHRIVAFRIHGNLGPCLLCPMSPMRHLNRCRNCLGQRYWVQAAFPESLD